MVGDVFTCYVCAVVLHHIILWHRICVHLYVIANLHVVCMCAVYVLFNVLYISSCYDVFRLHRMCVC